MKIGVTEKWRSETEHICPECGSVMEEVDRVNENGLIFIWYKCARVSCGEQWLEKKVALRLPANSAEAKDRINLHEKLSMANAAI
jgi:hypothetical protein